MQNALIEVGMAILTQLAITLISVAGAFLLSQIQKTEKLKTLSAAVDALTKAAETTVLELQQTVVDDLKAAAEDGKLTQDEISNLQQMLISKTTEKMSESTIEVLKAGGVDINGLIRGAGEALIARIHAGELSFLPVAGEVVEK